jgi:hypothetical protein
MTIIIAGSLYVRPDDRDPWVASCGAPRPLGDRRLSVVTERQQGTLEPVLTTPIRREEFLLAKRSLRSPPRSLSHTRPTDCS